MSNAPVITFIIPAYNAERVLERCVDSIVSEKYSGMIEIIIVENGSTDATLRTAQMLQDRYEEVKVLRSPKGVSKARNAGIEAASGEWIFFVDADDFLPEGALPLLCADAKSGDADLYIYSYEKGNNTVCVCPDRKRNVFRGNQVEKCRVEMLENPTRCMAVWAKLFRKKKIVKNSLKFNEMLRLSEDSDFIIHYSKYCNEICFCHEIAYHYSTEASSTVRLYDGAKAEAYVAAMKETRKFIDGETEPIQRAFHKYVLMHLNIIMVRDVFCAENPKKFFQKLKDMKNIIGIDIFQDARAKTNLAECKSVRMLPILLLKCKINLFAAFIYYIRAVQNHINEEKQDV